MESAGTPISSPEGWRFIFRALTSRNYRLFFGGQGVSLIGTWIQQTAMSWLVYHRTNSAFLLGLVGFTGQIPALILVPLAGVLTDRWNRYHLLILTQSLAMIQALALAFLDLRGTLTLASILILSLFLGAVNAFDMPTRQSLVVDLVEKKTDLGNAIALNSLIFNGARLIGPSLGGFLISFFGEGWCFLFNGVSFLAVIVALLAMKMPALIPKNRPGPLRQELREGVAYVVGFLPIRWLLLFLGFMSLVGMGYMTLLPIVAKDLLGGGPSILGFLMASSGLGALLGAIFLASRKTVLGLGRMIFVAVILFGTGMVIFSLSRVLVISLLSLSLTGFGMMVHMVSTNTILQTIVEDNKRGRLMSFFTLAFVGVAPFGSLLAGILAHQIGVPATLFLIGVLCFLASFLFRRQLPLLRTLVRPIYLQKGILDRIPE
jgi:MFS family permease